MGRSLGGGFTRIGAVAASLAVALAFAPSAAASRRADRPFASLPHLGPAPVRCELGTDPNCPEYTQGTNYTVESSCGAINISPHVVNLGEDVTATMVETARQCRIQWGTPPGKLVAGCKDGVYKEINPQMVETIVPPSGTCVWKATSASSYPPDAKAPGGGWDQFEVGFCAFVGCAALASDYFYVLPHKVAISGTVFSGTTDAVGNQTGLAGAVIKISGASSGTATTNQDGFYDALVDPGRYDVSVASVGGAPADMHPTVCDPGAINKSACQVQAQGRDAEADFTPCTAAATPADRTARTAASGVASCSLHLGIAIGPSQPGLAYNPEPGQGVARFFADTATGSCLSGCTDITVTVTSNGKAVANGAATVNASVTPVNDHAIPRYPRVGASSANPGNGYLCDASQVQSPTTCSAVGSHDLNGVPTDAGGQVHLRYWAPGLVQPQTIRLKVDATGCKCNAGGMQTGGPEKRTFTLLPHRLLYVNTDLSAFDADLLAKWTKPKGLAGILTDQADSSALDKAVDVLFGEVLEGGAGTAVTVAQTALGALTPDLRLQQQFAALVLDRFNFVEWGLGDTSGSGVYEYDPANDALPQSAFLDAFAGDAGTTGFAGGGLLWKLGKELAKAADFLRGNGEFLGKQSIHLTVYEVSYCDQKLLDCGPGYASVYTPGAQRRPGIEPFLYFYFTDFRAPLPSETGLHYVYSGSFVAPYNANAWMQAQKGGP
jgi:hypothetical protein